MAAALNGTLARVVVLLFATEFCILNCLFICPFLAGGNKGCRLTDCDFILNFDCRIRMSNVESTHGCPVGAGNVVPIVLARVSGRPIWR